MANDKIDGTQTVLQVLRSVQIGITPSSTLRIQASELEPNEVPPLCFELTTQIAEFAGIVGNLDTLRPSDYELKCQSIKVLRSFRESSSLMNRFESARIEREEKKLLANNPPLLKLSKIENRLGGYL
ncbi:MAG: hypothetical protein HOI53_08125 [Francisellaceae bacterium]|jgi:hypothetical protein|nr:hypothetical protein [Francisellaceae bacterium]MBT6207982.1 hypothetical protein [Francisellaceae bacterium]MBT6538067.1 hypothetical protein [Francisellaceae bacterium]